MKAIFLLVAFFVCLYGAESHEHEDSKRQVATAPATGVTESPADMLMRLKLLTYQQKLEAKEAKKKAKADKKAQKDAAFAAYMSAIAAGAVSPAAAAGTAPAGSAAAPAPAVAPMATIVPPMPMLPAMGLWKKSFLLSQIMAAAAAQNAQIAAAAAAAATTTTTPPPAAAVTEADDEDSDEDDEDKTISEIVKRYAPILREKFYGSHQRTYENEDDDEDEEDENEEVAEGYNAEEDPKYESGSFNKLGTGSPNGIGYEDAKVNQAGCSGSHIHICSGTTVYLTNPDDVTNQNPILKNPELKPDEAQNEDEEEEVYHPKFGNKRTHGGHRH